MSRDLPPLNGLRAFEAAARHLSFTRAAEELYVTQAAISHQVKGLEDHLGFSLFRRVNRGLMLTSEGQILFPAVRDGLDTMAAALRQIDRAETGAGALTVTTLDSIASAWLVPRLGRFRRRHPEIDVRITVSDVLVDFTRSNDVDLAIRYGSGKWPGVRVEHLMDETIFPVASPELIESGPGLSKPADLLKYPLLHDTLPESWSMWFEAAGVHAPEFDTSYMLEHSNLIAQAAMAGEGVGLGRSALVKDALETGRLVRLFDITLPAVYAYYVVAPDAVWDRPKVGAFRSWLADEVNDVMKHEDNTDETPWSRYSGQSRT
ncbi:MAG: transcriptional regulator GcvA [Rhodospirillales bacterium]|nr:transcriptional regulator GcvA [Rhodospirillales bacterium]